MPRKHTTIEILYPQRRRVDAEQIQRWASDDLANEEERTPADWRTIPIEYAVAIVHHHGSVTVADTHGLTLPEYTRGADVPGVRFYGVCHGHEPGPLEPMGVTRYCNGRCRPPGLADPETGEHIDAHGHLVRLEPPDEPAKGGAL